jgi:branched-chain amino acid aminotransferase
MVWDDSTNPLQEKVVSSIQGGILPGAMDRKAVISIDFKITDPNKAHIPVLDRGFILGDSVYEAVATYDSKPFLLDRHYNRLARSAGSISMALPFTLDDLQEHLEQVLKTLGEPRSYVRIVVSRGAYDFHLEPSPNLTPRTIIMASSITPWPEEYFNKGIKVSVVSIRRNLAKALNPMIKSGNYLNNVLAIIEAQKAGFDDAIMLNHEGMVTESTTSNVFIVKKNELLTPPMEAGILDGVSRGVVFEIAKTNNISLKEIPLSVSDLMEADEAFLTSTTREVMPIHCIDDRFFKEERPLTLKLQVLFKDYVQAHLS